jgi:hypothetical protein
MARPLSANSRKVLGQVGKAGKSIDELAARTGIRKDRLAKLLWHLQSLGWISVIREVRTLPVYRRVRQVPRPKSHDVAKGYTPAPHIAALQAAFGIGVPVRRARGRTVRRTE